MGALRITFKIGWQTCCELLDSFILSYNLFIKHITHDQKNHEKDEHRGGVSFSLSSLLLLPHVTHLLLPILQHLASNLIGSCAWLGKNWALFQLKAKQC